MKRLALIFFAVCLAAFPQNVAVKTHQSENSSQFKSGFPGGWPYLRPVDIGAATQAPPQLGAGWVVMPKAELDAQMATLAPQVEAWNRAHELKQRVPVEVATELRKRLSKDALAELKLQAAQTEILLLLVKAVAGSALTNNLTIAERQRVIAIRNGILLPHRQLYLAAKAMLDSASTNGTPSDPALDSSWPQTSIGE